MAQEAIEISVDPTQLNHIIANTPLEGSQTLKVAEIVSHILEPELIFRSFLPRIPYPPYVFHLALSTYPKGVCLMRDALNNLANQFYKQYEGEWEMAVLFNEEEADDPSVIINDFPDRPGVYSIKAFHDLVIPTNLGEIVGQKILEEIK